MNIDKIKNYNQKILALLGTAVLLLAIFGIISILIFTISDLIPKDDMTDTALLSDEKLEQLTQQKMRQQVISYNNAILIDTLQQKYIIPIMVRTLKSAEFIEDETDFFENFGSGSYSGKRYRRSGYNTEFNNLVYWDYLSNVMKPILDTRMIGSKLEYSYFEDDILVSFVGADVDSNNDGHVTLEDNKNLYFYSFKEQALRKIEHNNATVIDFKYRHKSMDAIVTFGKDRNEDGNYKVSNEPSYLMLYKFKENKLEPVLAESITKDLQALIENTGISND